MRVTSKWTGLRTAVLGLGLVAWAASQGLASPITYGTTGTIDSSGVTGANVVGFANLSQQNLPDAGTTFLSLGNFQVTGRQDGGTTSYSNTPFSITFQVDGANGKADPNLTPIVINGTLSGAVNGLNSNVLATFNPISNPTFTDGGNTYTLSFPPGYTTRPLVFAGSNTGESSAELEISVNAAPPIPEPSTIALFLTTLAGLGIRSRLRASRID
jgi:hypothetical protein